MSISEKKEPIQIDTKIIDKPNTVIDTIKIDTTKKESQIDNNIFNLDNIII